MMLKSFLLAALVAVASAGETPVPTPTEAVSKLSKFTVREKDTSGAGAER